LSEFVEKNFSSRISLTTVLVVLFTMTNNSDLLNLHVRQQHPLPNEQIRMISGWLKALARALNEKLGQDTERLFQKTEKLSNLNDDQKSTAIAIKLDALYKLLDLSPYDHEGVYHQGRCNQIKKEIEPAYVICPTSMQCQTQLCKERSLHMNTRNCDTPKATLIKGSTIYEDVHVLSGKCPLCKTIYYADHESSGKNDDEDGGGSVKFYLNNAKYLKVGQSVWVDRVFSKGVINGMYHFHASASVFAEFWNDTFWSSQKTQSRKISQRQIWHTFVQESIRTVAKPSGVTVEMPNGISIEEVTKQAFIQLGDNGVISSAHNHSCSECTHEYKETADRITGDDPAAVLGVDENHQVPVLVGEGAELAIEDAARARLNAQLAADAMDVDHSSQSSSSAEEPSPVKLVIMDGVVMDNYFVPPRFYCVETICAPCGAVHAWTLFDKAESPTNILNFLAAVYPTPDERPDYVCIDKACMVLRTAISNGAWNIWKETTRFIVDSYHYINHRTNDYLCRKWCNPAPLNGSAPNLVVVEYDINGNPHYKRAFNTQACEQLNAWIGGFQGIVNRMTIYNFKWFLHAMLFIHTQRVIRKQKKKDTMEDEEDEEGIDIEEEEE
ncbi:hypothetical protein PILCRDRAFT_79958, partial [Piloderma croceum F 1598]